MTLRRDSSAALVVPARGRGAVPGRRAARVALAALAASVLAAGCVRRSIGPATIPPARMDYNEAISRSWDEQLLLNLVRLRYRDNPLFVDVNSVTASWSMVRSGSLGARAEPGASPGVPDVTAGAGLSVLDNPVISYSYLRGEEFVQRLLSPLAPATLEALSQSGWSIERLLLCCVQAINGVENAIAAAGPTPDYVPDFERFRRVAAVFRQLQLARRVALEQEADGRTYLQLERAAGPGGEELRSLLALDRDVERFAIVAARRPGAPGEIAVRGRSLLAVMFFLSHAVDVPRVHREAGTVTVTRDSAGAEFDWARVAGPLMHIRSAREAPAAAAVSVFVRDHWYWIDDSDLNSKTTFALLRLLLFLKAGERQEPSPMVTIPAR